MFGDIAYFVQQEITTREDINANYKDINSFITDVNAGICPIGAKVDLRQSIYNDNPNKLDFVKPLSDILQSGKCPEGLEIHCVGVLFSAESLAVLFEALRSPNCPRALFFDFQYCFLGNYFRQNPGIPLIDTLIMELQTGIYSANLKIRLDNNDIAEDDLKRLLILQLQQRYKGNSFPQFEGLGDIKISSFSLLREQLQTLTLLKVKELSQNNNIIMEKEEPVEASVSWDEFKATLLDTLSSNDFKEIMCQEKLQPQLWDVLGSYIEGLAYEKQQLTTEEQYIESYLPAFQDVAEVIVKFNDQISDFFGKEKTPLHDKAAGLVVKLAAEILPAQFNEKLIEGPEGEIKKEALPVLLELSPETRLWAEAQRLKLLDKISDWPGSFHARQWENFYNDCLGNKIADNPEEIHTTTDIKKLEGYEQIKRYVDSIPFIGGSQLPNVRWPLSFFQTMWPSQPPEPTPQQDQKTITHRRRSNSFS